MDHTRAMQVHPCTSNHCITLFRKWAISHSVNSTYANSSTELYRGSTLACGWNALSPKAPRAQQTQRLWHFYQRYNTKHKPPILRMLPSGIPISIVQRWKEIFSPQLKKIKGWLLNPGISQNNPLRTQTLIIATRLDVRSLRRKRINSQRIQHRTLSGQKRNMGLPHHRPTINKETRKEK